MSALLFNIFFGAIIKEFEMRTLGMGAKRSHNPNGSIFDVSKMESQGQFEEVPLQDVLHADDAAIVAAAETVERVQDRMQQMVDV